MLKALLSLTQTLKISITLIIPYIEQKYQSFHCFIPYVLWNLFFKILHSGIFHWFKPQTVRPNMEKHGQKGKKSLAWLLMN